MNQGYKAEKAFPPLDDLFDLLQKMEGILGVEIGEPDYKVGREQLFYTFMHETMHAFIGKMAPWIYSLAEDETDFIDEVVVRILIDHLLKKENLHSKVKLFYDNHVNHRQELELYGYNLSPEQYDAWEKTFYTQFVQGLRVNDFCQFIRSEYNRIGMKRNSGYSYKVN